MSKRIIIKMEEGTTECYKCPFYHKWYHCTISRNILAKHINCCKYDLTTMKIVEEEDNVHY